MAGLYFSSDIDTKKYDAKLKGMQNSYKKTSRIVTSESDKMSRSFQKMAVSLGVVFSASQAAGFIKQLVKVRAEMEQLEIAYSTMLGSTVKGRILMEETVEFAKKTPFDVRGVALGAKMLLAYGTEAHKVTEELTLVGNIAKGLSLPLQDVIYLYGTTRTQGVLFTRDLRQFMGRGIPLAEELAKELGISEKAVGKLVTEGKIGFDLVQKAMQNMTAEGGRFYKLMDTASKAIGGKLANLGDKFTQIYNEIGKSNEDIIIGAIDGASNLADHYETIGKSIAELIIIYGSYKAALLTTMALQSSKALITNIRLVALMRKELGLLTAVQQAFNVTVSQNPFVWIGVAVGAIAGLTGTIALWGDSTDKVAESLDQLGRYNRAVTDGMDEEMSKISQLRDAIHNENLSYKQRNKALLELKSIVPDYHANLREEGILINDNAEAIDKYSKNFERQIRIEAAQDELADAYRRKRELERDREQKKLDIELAKQRIEQANQVQSIDTGSVVGLLSGTTTKPDFTPISRALDLYQANEDLNHINKSIIRVTKNIDVLFDEIDAATITDPEDSEIISFSEQLKEADSRVKILTKRLQDLRLGKIEVPDIAETILQTEKDLTKARERLDALLGSSSEQIQRELLSSQKKFNKEALANAERLRLAEIALKRAGIKDKLEIIEHEKQAALDAIDVEEEAYKNLAKAAGIKPEEIDLSVFTKRRKIVQKQAAVETALYEQEQLAELIEQYKSYEQEREEIIKTYDKAITILTKNGEIERAEAAKKARDKELANLDATANKTKSILSKMFKDVTTSTYKDIEDLYTKASDFLDFLTSPVDSGSFGEDLISFGITEEQFKYLSSTPEELDKIRKAILRLKDSMIESAPFSKKLAISFKEMQDGMNTNNLTLFNQGLQHLTSTSSAVSKALQGVSQMFQNIADLSGDSTLGYIAQLASDMANVLDTTAQMALVGGQLGGQIGAIAGAAVGLISAITGIFVEAKANRAKLRKQIANDQMQEYLGEYEINAIWRERYEWAKKIGESTLQNIKRQGVELSRQAKANAKEQQELSDKLFASAYKSNEYFKKTGLFGWGKGRIVTEWASLANKEWSEIEKLAQQGKLSEEGQKYYEALKKAKEEGADLEQRQIEYLEKVREIFTGTTYDNLVSGIVKGFADGKRSAEDFANSFDQLMRKSIQSALTLLAEEDMRNWYEKFAKFAKDGLTKEEIAILKKEYIRLSENLEKQADDLEDITGIDFIDKAKREAKVKGIARASQESVDENNARLTAIQGHTFSIMNGVQAMLLLDKATQQYQTAMLGQVALLVQNTSTIVQSTNNIQNTVDNISIKGVILKR